MRWSPIRFVPEGEILPRGFGVAWDDPMRRGCVVIPIPFNVIAAPLRLAWLWLKRGRYRREVYKLKIENMRLAERVRHLEQANHFLTDLAVELELRDQARLEKEFPTDR